MSKMLLELNAQQKEIKISPVGLFSGYDGRIYIVDEKSVANTIAKGIDIPLNVEHGFTSKNREAVGWFKVNTMKIKDDGVYVNLELTKEGQELIKTKKYRYLSPEFHANEAREVINIYAVGLINTPNLQLEINKLQHQNQNKDEKMEKELQEQLNALTNENKILKELNVNLTTTMKENMLNSAIEKNTILPKEKEHLKELNMNTLSTYLGSRGPLGQVKKELNANNSQGGADEALHLAQNMGW